MLMFALQLMFSGARKLYRIARTIYIPFPLSPAVSGVYSTGVESLARFMLEG